MSLDEPILMSRVAYSLGKGPARWEPSAKPEVRPVPQKDMDKAAEAMRSVGVGGTVKNLFGTKRRQVLRKK